MPHRQHPRIFIVSLMEVQEIQTVVVNEAKRPRKLQKQRAKFSRFHQRIDAVLKLLLVFWPRLPVTGKGFVKLRRALESRMPARTLGAAIGCLWPGRSVLTGVELQGVRIV